MAFTYRKRTFLDPASTGTASYILAEVEDSRNGEYPWGHYMLTIADCRRRIQLEFFLGKPKSRRQSLAKFKLLQNILNEFGEALTKEANLKPTRSQKKGGRRMRLKLFTCIVSPSSGTQDMFELEINAWLQDNQRVEIQDVFLSSSQQDFEPR